MYPTRRAHVIFLVMHVYTTRCQHGYVHVRRRPALYVIRRRRWHRGQSNQIQTVPAGAKTRTSKRYHRGQKQTHQNGATGGQHQTHEHGATGGIIKDAKTVPPGAATSQAVAPGAKATRSKQYHRGQIRGPQNGTTGGKSKHIKTVPPGGSIKHMNTVPPGASSKTSKRYRRVQHPFPHPQHLYLQRSPWSISQGAAPWRDGLSICVQAEPAKAEVRKGRCRLCTIWSGVLCKRRCEHGLMLCMPPRPRPWDRVRPRPQALLVCVSRMRVAMHQSQRSRPLTRPLAHGSLRHQALPVILGNARVAMYRSQWRIPLRTDSRRMCMITVS